MNDNEWKKTLTPEAYYVTRQKGTERPFTSELLKNKETGEYTCVCCDKKLFDSETKFDSHCGWPAFYAAADGEKNIERHEDRTHGMVRTEVTCKSCGAHLGHVFDDGPRDKTGERFCINGVALKFKKI